MKTGYYLIFIFFIACNSTPMTENLSNSVSKIPYTDIKTGGSKLIELDNKYKVWTKKVGDGAIKVLLLHGGPGFTHDYLECFEDFLPKAGIQFYYYDQLGAGNSDIPNDTSLWHLPRFVDEIEQVRKGLGLDTFYLYGQSWGAMLAMEYLQKYQKHVKAAILSNMTASITSYTAYAEKLKQKLFTKEQLDTYNYLDKHQLYDSPQYQNLLMNTLYSRVLCRIPLNYWPEPLLRSFKKMNPIIYNQMQGMDEFHITGNFKNWDMWHRLPNIRVPTLVIAGYFDEMNPEDIKKEGSLIPNSRTIICPNGSHLSMYDDQEYYFKNLIQFLKEVEAGSFVADRK